MKRGIKVVLSFILAFSVFGNSVYATEEEGNNTTTPQPTEKSNDENTTPSSPIEEEPKEAPQKTYVAKIGDVSYETINAALAEATSGAEVVLLMDVKEDVVVASGKNVVLNLNGKTLTNDKDHTIVNNGTLKITGNGTVDNISHGRAAVYNKADATATLESATITRTAENGNTQESSGGNSFYNVLNQGDMTIKAGVTIQQSGSYSSLIENGWYTASQNTSKVYAKMTVEGGTFIGGKYTIKNDDYGIMTIKDGTFTNTTVAAILNWHDLTISGGIFTSGNYAIYNGADPKLDYEQGKLTIEGGSFNCGAEKAVIYDAGGIYTLKGGVYSNKPADEMMKSGYAVYEKDGSFYVLEKSTSITLSEKPSELEQHSSKTITATVQNELDTITWESSDTTIATVVDGVITALKPGKVTITVSAADIEEKWELTVKVNQQVGVETEVSTTTPEVKIPDEIKNVITEEQMKNAQVEFGNIGSSVAQDKEVITDDLKTTSLDELKVLLNNDTLTMDDVKIVIQTYTDIEVKSMTEDTTGKKVLTLDITPKFNLVGTKSDVAVGDMDASNSVTLSDNHVLKVTETVKVEVPVGSLLKDAASSDEELKKIVFVEHTAHDGKVYYHNVDDITGTDDAKMISFTNGNGFSEFKIVVDARIAKVSFSNGNTAQEYRFGNINQKLPTPPLSNQDVFDGWKYNGVVYTTLTKELYEAIAGKTVTLELVSHKKIESKPVDTTDNDGNASTYVVPNTGYKGK